MPSRSLMGKGPILDVLESDAPPCQPALVDLSGEVGGESAVPVLEAEFEVEAQADGIPVRTSDQGPGFVDHEYFRMIERRPTQPDSAAGFEGAPEKGVGCPLHQPEIALLGQDDVDLDTAPRRHRQRLGQAGKRQEVGGHDPHTSPGAGERPEEALQHAAEVFVGAVSDRPADGGTPNLVVAVPGVSCQPFSGTEVPVVLEDAHQLFDHRTFDAEVEIADRLAGIALDEVSPANVHAAREGDPAVDDEELSVTPQVRVRQSPGKPGRHEAHGLDAGPLERPGDRRERVAHADGVDQDPDFHASFDGKAESRDEPAPFDVVVEDVRRQGDRTLGVRDRLEHGGVGLFAAIE